MKSYVRIDYSPVNRITGPNPDVQECASEKEADGFVDTCLKWGIGIVSCKKVTEEEAKRIMER